MLYAMRDKSGAIDPNSEGTWVRADGAPERLPPGSFSIEKTATWKSEASGAVYPSGWHILVPEHKADLTVSPALADQELHLDKMGALDLLGRRLHDQGNGRRRGGGRSWLHRIDRICRKPPDGNVQAGRKPMSAQKIVFEVEKLRVEREAVILHEVNWRVERGHHWVILGANGSGKTSLLSA